MGEAPLTRPAENLPPRADGWRRVLLAALVLKAGVFATIVLGYFFFPFQTANFGANFRWPPGEAPGFAAHFKTWDAQHYLFLADRGYGPWRQSNAFYPLFPFMIRAFRFLFFQNTLWTGLFLSNLLSLAAIFYLYRLAEKKYGEKTAVLSCLFLAAFPTAFYLDLVYAESLFLALAAAFFYYLEEGKPAGSVLCSFLLPLTRPMGLLVLAPALAFLFFNRRSSRRPSKLERAAVPSAFLAGFAFYLVLMKRFTGDGWAGFHAQRFFTSGYGVSNLFHPWNWLMANFLAGPYSWMGFGTGLLDRAFFVLFLITAFLAYRRLEKPYFIYALVLSLVPALSGDLASYCRYWVVLFPLFTVLALKFGRRPGYYLGICLPLQGALALAHSLNYWVG